MSKEQKIIKLKDFNFKLPGLDTRQCKTYFKLFIKKILEDEIS